jgi:hypothetical protein
MECLKGKEKLETGLQVVEGKITLKFISQK